MKRFMSFVLAFACMCAALTPLAVFCEAAVEEEIFFTINGETILLSGLSEDQLTELYSKIPQFRALDPDQAQAPTVEELLTAGAAGIVWLSRTGNCYHSKPKCGSMKEGIPTTLAFAQMLLKTPCKNCH